MSGRTDLFLTFVVFVSSLAAASDLLFGKIYNWLTLPVLVGGLLLAAVFEGSSGFLGSFLGIAAALALFGWMFALRLIGGGDVKLLMAFGAIGGYRFSTEVALVSVLVGGGISFFILLFRGKILTFSRKIYRFLLSIAVKELDVEVPVLDQKLTMPFGVPMAIAAIGCAWKSPLGWGRNLWL